MEPWIVPSLIISPLLALFVYLYIRFKFPEGNYSQLIVSFMLGVAVFVLVIIAEYLAEVLNLNPFKSIRRTAFYGFIVVGGVREFGKFLMLRLYNVPKNTFKNPSDGIIFTVMIAMGLSTVMVLYYALGYGMDKNLILRVYAHGPMLFMIALVMGFFVGFGKFRKNMFIDYGTGLLAAVFFHGLFELSLMTNDLDLFYILAIGLAVISLALVVKAVRLSEDDLPYLK
ncbi:MAG: PrsW family intramembrane metalloprotease [Bacteroidales bacterium]|nr:PrsW family intramembrane metalloprotease [Bacteroidales bacterium]